MPAALRRPLRAQPPVTKAACVFLAAALLTAATYSVQWSVHSWRQQVLAAAICGHHHLQARAGLRAAMAAVTPPQAARRPPAGQGGGATLDTSADSSSNPNELLSVPYAW